MSERLEATVNPEIRGPRLRSALHASRWIHSTSDSCPRHRTAQKAAAEKRDSVLKEIIDRLDRVEARLSVMESQRQPQ